MDRLKYRGETAIIVVQRYRSYSQHLTTAITAVVVVLFFFSCKDNNEDIPASDFNPEEVASMVTHDVTTFISEAGITRYKLDADVWMVYDRAKEPYWYFPDGIHVEILHLILIQKQRLLQTRHGDILNRGFGN